jgi:transcriptional regulator with XRE-family HTH domain
MEENPLCPFGDVLVKARKDRDITQYRLAKLTKRSARYISMLEHNAREQQLSTGLLLARALRMDAGNWPATLTHAGRMAIPDDKDFEPKRAGHRKKICGTAEKK